ncbi:hypothetical protein RJ639_016867 [Escallonia herrerae]|uniref:Uncharacterized protein n=1 Tax=Escallonia herrerae TaxID=1293975 RepID=A0AA89ALN3_9ASTE|nr:hypothetical protein RJ639_016867 [Escallonia herrerae]
MPLYIKDWLPAPIHARFSFKLKLLVCFSDTLLLVNKSTMARSEHACILLMLSVVTLSLLNGSKIVAEARHLLETTLPELPKPELPELPSFPKVEMPPLPDFPSLPKPELPNVPELPHLPEIHDLPKPTLPTIPALPKDIHFPSLSPP